MSLSRYYARAGGDPELIARVAHELTTRWDPNHEFDSAEGDVGPDAHARAVLGILATGADFAAVRGYLRRAEEVVLGEARSDGRLRHEIAEWVWRAMVDVAIEAQRRAGGDAVPT